MILKKEKYSNKEVKTKNGTFNVKDMFSRVLIFHQNGICINLGKNACEVINIILQSRSTY